MPKRSSRPTRGSKPKRPTKPTGPLELRNPHAVLATLNHRPEAVVEVRIGGDQLSPAWQRVVAAAETHRRPIRSLDPSTSRAADTKSDDRRATLATARVHRKQEVSLGDLFRDSADPAVWLALEHIQDPHNLGAIVRTAAFFGVRGLILTKDQSAALTAVAYDIAAGGVEAIDHTTVVNMSRTLDAAKDANIWTVATSEHAEVDVASIANDRRWLVVVGNEESGLRRLTKEKCDLLVGIPCLGEVTSLNVSVAAGIVLSRIASPLPA